MQFVPLIATLLIGLVSSLLAAALLKGRSYKAGGVMVLTTSLAFVAALGLAVL